MRTNKHCSHRQCRKKLNGYSKEKLLIKRDIWGLVVIARLIAFLTLILIHYR